MFGDSLTISTLLKCHLKSAVSRCLLMKFCNKSFNEQSIVLKQVLYLKKNLISY